MAGGGSEKMGLKHAVLKPVRKSVVAGAADPRWYKEDSKTGNACKRRSSQLVIATASQAQRSCTTEALSRDSPSSKPRYSIDTTYLAPENKPLLALHSGLLKGKPVKP